MAIKTLKPACYLRCSTKTQDTEAQKAAIQRYLAGNGITVPPNRWYIDEAVSGTTMERPAMTALNDSIFNGQVDAVILYDVARFARAFISGLNTLDRWQKAGVKLVFVSQGIEVDPAEWTGQIVMKILIAITLAFSEAEHERIRNRAGNGIIMAKEKVAAARKMLAEGQSPQRVAIVLGLKLEHIKHLIEYPTATCYWGGGRRGPRKTHASLPAIKKLRDSGFSYREIASMLKVSKVTVWNRLKEAGLTAGPTPEL